MIQRKSLASALQNGELGNIVTGYLSGDTPFPFSDATKISGTAATNPLKGVTYDALTGKAVTLDMDLFSPGWASREFDTQWHLRYLGDIETVWNDFTGKGVSVGVYDEGVDRAHWDLAVNYDASKHLVDNGRVIDGGPVYRGGGQDEGAHGTAVAGLIGAAHNGRGGVGVAYDVQITGVNIFDQHSKASDTLWSIPEAVGRFDITSHSWGFSGLPLDRDTSRGFSEEGRAVERSLDYISVNGRDGLGTIFVKAAGNDSTHNFGDPYNGDRHSIIVGAYRQVDGVASYYSSSGPYLLVSAPSNDYDLVGGTGLVTTDILGWRGYNQAIDPETAADYTNSFGGTSGATPIVSGVVSLMLDANENLGWRDVRDILAASAKMPVAFGTGPVVFNLESGGSRLNIALNESQFKLAGQSANWNGGAMHYSNDYGYGAVDAYSAVRMSEVWSLFGSAKTSANEVHVSVATDVGITAIGSTPETNHSRLSKYNDFVSTPTGFEFEVADNIDLEHVDLSLNFSNLLRYLGTENGVDSMGQFFTVLNEAQIKLIAPDGTEAFAVMTGGANWQADEHNAFMFGFTGFHGTESKGTWKLEISGISETEQTPEYFIEILRDLTVNSLKMDLYGSAPTKDDVYTYTNEFFKMLAIAGEADRATLSDKDGGIDWINAAAVSANVALDLSSNGSGNAVFGGTNAFTIERGSVIENAVTGDGNDVLTGNNVANKLYGMRGDDKLFGLGGMTGWTAAPATTGWRGAPATTS